MAAYQRSIQVLKKNLDTKLLAETLHRPWMRLQLFLDEGPLSRTPECYKKFFYEWKVETPTPVHYIPEEGNWKYAEDGRIIPVQNIPLDLRYPHQLHNGIWGGEAVVKGFIKKKPRRRRVARYWVPLLRETVVYSEILDRYIRTQVTPRALELIDQHYGLDPYLMKTKPADLMSEFALKLKREILYSLLHKTIYPDDPAKRDEIYEKYKEYIIPEEELEWFGLNLSEAYRKQYKLDEQAKYVGPYKDHFRREFIDYMKRKKLESEQSDDSKETQSLVEKVKSLSIFAKSK